MLKDIYSRLGILYRPLEIRVTFLDKNILIDAIGAIIEHWLEILSICHKREFMIKIPILTCNTKRGKRSTCHADERFQTGMTIAMTHL